MMETLRTLFRDYGAELVTAIGQHTVYVLISVAIGFVVGLLAGILLSRIPRRLSGVIIPVLSIFQTIPAWCSSACSLSAGATSIPPSLWP